MGLGQFLGNIGSKIKGSFADDKGFFQGGKSFGGRGLKGVLGDVGKAMRPKPYAGIPGVCPYTGKPLRTPQEQASGVSDEAAAQGAAGGAQQPSMGGQPSPLQGTLADVPTAKLGDQQVAMTPQAIDLFQNLDPVNKRRLQQRFGGGAFGG